MCKNFVAALGLLVLATGPVLAQNPGQPPQPGTQPRTTVTPGGQPRAQAGGLTTVDNAIASCLALGNQEEIALARFAQDSAKSKEVKEFAKMMSDEHKAALQKLRQIAPQVATVGDNLEAGANQDAAQQRTAQPGQQLAGADGRCFRRC